MPEGEWYTGLVCDGLLTGLDSIFSFLPQIMLLFLFISILEDSGYMARVAFIMDRAFRRFGLSGKAFIPLLIKEIYIIQNHILLQSLKGSLNLSQTHKTVLKGSKFG